MREPSDPRAASSSPSNSPSSSGRATSSTHDRQPRRQRRPAGPPELHLRDVVDVEDPARLVDCAQMERQLRFQHLVRRYISQILYGCTSAYCTTPTCLSCNKRLTSRPFRAPTKLTARALAHFLASQDNPHRGLCPHQLKVAPSTLDINGALGVQVRARRVLPVTDPWTQLPHNDPKPGGTLQDDAARILDAVRERHQTRKDPKALVQNVFDTVTVIYSYSKQIPSPSSIFALLRSDDQSQATGEQTAEAERNVASPLDHAPDSHSNQQRTPSRTNTRIVSEVLSSGQRIHRIRHLPAESGLKIHDSSTLDGVLDSQLSSPKTRTRPPSLELHRAMVPQMSTSARNVTKPVEKKTPVLPVASHLTCDIMDQLKEDVYHRRNKQYPGATMTVDYDSNRSSRPSKPFVNRSMFYALSNPETLIRSFRDEDCPAYKESPLPHLNSTRLVPSFRDWNRRNGALVFDSLWIAVEALFRPPPEIDVQKSPRLKPSRKNAAANGSFTLPPPATDSASGRYLKDAEAAHIVMICIHALTSLVPVGWPHTWIQLRKFRSWGIILPNAPPHTDFSSGFIDPWLSIIDELEYEPAIRLADRLVRGIGARLCFEQILASLGHRERLADDGDHPERHSSLISILVQHLERVEENAMTSRKKSKGNLDYDEDPGWTVTATFVEWLRTIVIKNWDGKAEVNRWGNIGAAVMLLGQFHSKREPLNLRPSMFCMPYLNERMDAVTEPTEFVGREYAPNSFHLFQYPCLFPADYLVGYFRTVNFTNMFKQYERTERAAHLQRSMEPYLKEPYWYVIRNQLKVTLSDYLVLDVSRNNALKDTLDQLWGQETRSLLKPLKVKMGMQEGEVGLDQGGVTYEFFRVVLHEAFKPDTGMFTLDPQTRMTWFQPASLEPEWKFEMLGLLFSLALYNGITLPVTFPKAFYHAMLPSSPTYPYSLTSTDFIRDGWPTLAKSFDELLSWADGDVADIFMRSYTFSFEAFGQNVDVDMRAFEKHGSPSLWPADDEGTAMPTISPFGSVWHPRARRPPLASPAWSHPETAPNDAPLVTNANRDDFVRDYILWLTTRSVASQLVAFRRGFNACLNPASLFLFDPLSLRALVEGRQDISIPDLRSATRYEDGYTATHPTIQDFWAVVDTYAQEDRRRLLEFVTASERVPVTGFESMNFVIVRQGADTDMLPTSSTCFGKLMLPQYEGRAKLERKLALAIRNSRGFGVV